MSKRKKKLLFIVNPKAGLDREKALTGVIQRYLDLHQFDYRLKTTQHAKHGVAMAKQAVQEGYDGVIVVGGDGSINDVLNGIYGSDLVLGIIPKGSGNGLARSLNLPFKEQKAIEKINQWQFTTIDLGLANGHLFASNAGVGFDADVTQAFKDNRVRGFFSYLGIIVRSIWRYKEKDLHLTTGQEEKQQAFFMLTIANAPQLGYNFKIAPKALLDDGYFDLVQIRKFPKIMGAFIGLRAFLGRIENSSYVKISKIKEVAISHPDLKVLQIDGDALPCHSKVSVEILPKAQKVLI